MPYFLSRDKAKTRVPTRKRVCQEHTRVHRSSFRGKAGRESEKGRSGPPFLVGENPAPSAGFFVCVFPEPYGVPLTLWWRSFWPHPVPQGLFGAKSGWGYGACLRLVQRNLNGQEKQSHRCRRTVKVCPSVYRFPAALPGGLSYLLQGLHPHLL